MSDLVERLRRPVFDSEEWYSALGAAFKMRDAGHRDSCARDLMDSYVDEAATERTEAADEIERLRAQVARLTRMLDDPGTTHAEGCATWGPKHWQCALNERDALRASLASEKECQGAFVIRVLGQEAYDNSPCQAHPLELVENEIERLRAGVGHWREANRTSLTAGDVLKDEVVRLTAENDWLRAYTAQSAKACVYCGLGADEQGKCNRGFPGCARADDQMLCREVEVAMERDELLARVEAAERDAGRYRWLRNESLHRLIRGPICIDADTWGEPVMACGKHITLDGATLDSAIDAAMEGGK